jgi:hypothetical protein
LRSYERARPERIIIDGSQTNREAIIVCDRKSHRRAGLDALMLRHSPAREKSVHYSVRSALATAIAELEDTTEGGS